MKFLTLLVIAPLLAGCSGMVIQTQTSGFDPATAAKIHKFFDGTRKLCPEGVASETRSMRAQAYNANRDQYYRPAFSDQKQLTVSETSQTIICKDR